MRESLLEMKGISKSFGGNLVLSDVELILWPHEVHVLVGENGAGKSTLMKILAGVYSRDSGSITSGGKEVKIGNPHDARSAGISMIFQEHTLAPHLSVAENIFLGCEPRRRGYFLDEGEMIGRARELLGQHGFSLDATARVERLSRAEKQMVEIARALISATRVVIMDEPTAMLSRRECDELFRIIGELCQRGLGIVYITHRLEELPRIADRITVLRDGRRVYSGEFSSIDDSSIIRHMVGREIEDLYPARRPPGQEPVLEVRSLSDGRQYHNVSFVLHRGEILGLAGLVGAGRTAVARALFGLEPLRGGTILLGGQHVNFRSSRTAIQAGLGYLTEDRKITSIFPQLSLTCNISLAGLGKITRGGLLRLAEEEQRCRNLIAGLRIKAPSGGEPCYRLSGGNQQKAIFARWLFAASTVLILDEPTQGVDLGARADIYRLMHEITDRGGAILMISSDLPELLGMSHRIVVMRRGEVVANLEADRTSQEEIMRHAALIQQ